MSSSPGVKREFRASLHKYAGPTAAQECVISTGAPASLRSSLVGRNVRVSSSLARISAGMNNPAQQSADAAGARLKYWAFLSYSHRDASWANWLHRSVESYRPPKALIGTVGQHGPIPRRLSPMFRDREELATATDLGTVIAEALRQSACQIVICSRQSAKSKWVNEEILAFKRLGREARRGGDGQRPLPAPPQPCGGALPAGP